MKKILGTLLIIIGLVLWIIILIPSFILRYSWKFNDKSYNFKFNYNDWTDGYKDDLIAIPSIYASNSYTYKSYYHYLFNIK